MNTCAICGIGIKHRGPPAAGDWAAQCCDKCQIGVSLRRCPNHSTTRLYIDTIDRKFGQCLECRAGLSVRSHILKYG